MFQFLRRLIQEYSHIQYRTRNRRGTTHDYGIEGLESRTMLSAPEILFFLWDGELGEGYYGRPVKTISFDSSSESSFDVSQTSSTGSSSMSGSVTETAMGNGTAYTFETTWNSDYSQSGGYLTSGGNGATGDIAVYVKGADDTPYHLDIEIETHATVVGSFSNYVERLSKPPHSLEVWQGFCILL